MTVEKFTAKPPSHEGVPLLTRWSFYKLYCAGRWIAEQTGVVLPEDYRQTALDLVWQTVKDGQFTTSAGNTIEIPHVGVLIEIGMQRILNEKVGEYTE